MTAVIDYGVGNLFSLTSSLRKIGAEVSVTSDPCQIKAADRIILPGVGAFRDAREKLRITGLDALIIEEAGRGKPILGICLGMQMLFDLSCEYGEHEGLSLIRGKVVPMRGVIPKELRIPHIGWNPLIFSREHPIFKYINEGDCVYFVHSYYASECDSALTAYSEYGANITAAVACGNVSGVQFHPEKSGDVGLDILRGFIEWDGR